MIASKLDPVITICAGGIALIGSALMFLYRKEFSDLYRKWQKIGYPQYEPWVFAFMAAAGLLLGILLLISGISRW